MSQEDIQHTIARASREKWRELRLPSRELRVLPREIGNLTSLVTIDLRGNFISELPREIGKLSNLSGLFVSNNRLTSLPEEIRCLSKLTHLSLDGNRLAALPPEIGDLSFLVNLDLVRNKLKKLPKEIGNLSKLNSLQLEGNYLTELPSEIGTLRALKKLNLNGNNISLIPPEIGMLSGLVELHLDQNRLTNLPSELGKLSKLKTLNLMNNWLTQLPREIGNLCALETLDLDNNRIRTLPSEIGKLSAISGLFLSNNQITSLPREIGDLSNLIGLDVDFNMLSSLPAEIGQLTALTGLGADNNQISILPQEIGNISKLFRLSVNNNKLKSIPQSVCELKDVGYFSARGNPLKSPPPEVANLGIKAVCSYFEEMRKSGEERQWQSKLLLIGQGGVGKTSLLRHLRKEPFDPNEDKTRGIEILPVELKHPKDNSVTMTLSTWDFGGQDIYHATHQFFMSNRSLFILLWNARTGEDESRVRHWLENIKARAPDSPIILVATHTDEHPANIAFRELKKEFPGLLRQFFVSNKTGDGIDVLREFIRNTAANLPLMGDSWPHSWLETVRNLDSAGKKHVTRTQLMEIMGESGVPAESHETLGQTLHELGRILYFHDHDELRDWIALDPHWISDQVYHVLDDPEITNAKGYFSGETRRRVWGHLDPGLHHFFVSLMEAFDLSYRTNVGKLESLVVECLPSDPPEYEDSWAALANEKEVILRYRLSTVPPGIPTWFIARNHWYKAETTTHWRMGAMLRSPDKKHLALVQANRHRKEVSLAVRGPLPYEFFSVLKRGLEQTLDRYKGLDIHRFVPCPCQGNKEDELCNHEFDLRHLESRMAKGRKRTIECPISEDDLPLSLLLFGLSVDRPKRDQGQVHVLNQLLDEGFRQFAETMRDLEQSRIDSPCPRLIALNFEERSELRSSLGGMKAKLHLCCEAPNHQHILDEAPINVEIPPAWFRFLAPHLAATLRIAKFVGPFTGTMVGLQDADLAKELKYDLQMIEKMIATMPADFDDSLPEDLLGRKNLKGAGLRRFCEWLKEKDSTLTWQGLELVITIDNQHLWLCREHASYYREKF